MPEARKTVASNRRARYDYEIVDEYEAGIALLGSEVKSLRAGQAQLKDAYADIRGGEMWLENMHIAPYAMAREGGHDPERPRKLLMHRREIDRLFGRVREEGLTLIPLSVYITNGRVKVEIALAKGRPRHDKRRKIVDRQQQREMDRARGRR